MSNYQSVFNRDKSILYTDIPLYKKLNSNKTLDTLINSEALAQAFKIWLVSGRGEKVRSKSGGWLLPFIGKEMSEDNADRIKASIVQGLQYDFTPPITITQIDVIADTQQNKWIIKVEGYNKDINLGINTYTVVNNT